MSGANSGNGMAALDSLPDLQSYYDLLKPMCRRLEIWHTIYNQVMEGPEAMVEWFRGSALRSVLAGLYRRREIALRLYPVFFAQSQNHRRRNKDEGQQQSRADD
jgi:trans-aconitate methyltransferase